LVRTLWLCSIVNQTGIRSSSPTSTISTIYPDYPTSVKLGDVIKAYGEPSHVLARALPNPDSDSCTFDLRIIYRSQGFVLTEGALSKLNLSENTFLDLAIFAPSDENAFEEVLAGGATSLDWIQPWQGIQSFDFYCKDFEHGKACQGER